MLCAQLPWPHSKNRRQIHSQNEIEEMTTVHQTNQNPQILLSGKRTSRYGRKVSIVWTSHHTDPNFSSGHINSNFVISIFVESEATYINTYDLDQLPSEKKFVPVTMTSPLLPTTYVLMWVWPSQSGGLLQHCN